jgi:FeS assembly SUF system protein
MMNFLSKFLSKKPDDENGTVTEIVSEPESTPEPVVAEPVAAEPIAAAAAERPMHYVDPHSGMPNHIDPPLGELEEFVSVMGESLLPDAEKADEDAVIDAMRTVYDPEIPVNIYDLGLIYTVNHEENGDINVEMSLTAPGCPVAGEMPGMVSSAVSQIEGVGVVTTKIVWDPAWTMDRMSEDAKLALGMF